MTFNVHIAQFDIVPTLTCAGVSLIYDYLIHCKICDITLGGERGLRNVTKMGKG